MSGSRLEIAQRLHANMKLPDSLYPVRPFGANSAFGIIFETRNGKIMKIGPTSANANREAHVARVAGNAGIGPKIHNVITTRSNLSKQLFRSANGLQIVIMNKVRGATSFYNSIEKSTRPINWATVRKVIANMHAAGIHHGNLHGDNILVEYDDDGTPTRAWIIDFGASTLKNNVKNLRTAVLQLRLPPYRRVSPNRRRSYTVYYENGRTQRIVPNSRSIEALRRFAASRAPFGH